MPEQEELIKCKNPLCTKMISPIKRRNNSMGISQYCSRHCYYTFSPGMVEVYEKLIRLKGLTTPPADPNAFMAQCIKEIYRRFPTWTARAACLGIKRQSFIRWIKHFHVDVPLEG